MERQLTGGNRPQWDSTGLAPQVCSVCMFDMSKAPTNATSRLRKTIPSESARVGVEEDSLAENTVSDPGLEMTTRHSTVQEITTSSTTAALAVKGHKLQNCICGWSKVTSYLGLRIHQGKKGCLREEQQRPRIDYFLRKVSNQSNEAQQQDANHSLQCISTSVAQEVTSNTEKAVVVSSIPPTQSERPAVEKKMPGRRPQVKWPSAAQRKLWETINTDLSTALEQLKGTAERKLESMGDVIYHYGMERFGVLEKNSRKQLPVVPTSRRLQEIRRLVQERRQLKRQWKKASEVEKEGINALQAGIKSRLSSLRKTETLRKRRKKKEHTRTQFYKDPYKFLKGLFSKEKSGILKTTKKDLEDHLRNTHLDPRRHEHLAIPSDIPPILPPKYQCDIGPPTWKEVERVIHRARTASAPGPNGVSYKVYKNSPDVLRLL